MAMQMARSLLFPQYGTPASQTREIPAADAGQARRPRQNLPQGEENMDIRNIGAPITASQRHSYRETPDSSFFASFQAAYKAQTANNTDPATPPTDKPPAADSLASILGITHSELSAMRGVSAESQATYAAVLNKAYSSGGIGNARQFLGTLSAQELEAVRQNHCLAAPIDTATLSEEGAENLLLPEGYSVDLNHDGIDEVGAARTAHFPPADSPAEFREAWFQATAGMDEGMMMTYGLMMHDAVYGMQIDGQTRVAPYAADDIDSYRSIVRNYLASLESTRGWLADGQYERDKTFFEKLQGLLGA